MSSGWKRRRAAGPVASACLALSCLPALVLVPAAAASTAPAKVQVGKVRLALPVHGRGALLIPVRYPIQLVGHRLDLRVSLLGSGGSTLRTWVLRPRASAGVIRRPERRRRFTFVHQIDLSRRLTRLQIAMMGKLLNQQIASVAAEVSTTRLQVISPPHFNVGVDISPVYPSRYSCSLLGFKVDGPSVQSTPSQDELEILHPFSFCQGPVPKGPPWVISGDTGIHPSAAGYAQMATRVPAPR